MNRTLYLIDNNALVALKSERVKSKFLSAHCRVTADVLLEASENRERRGLVTLTEPVTPTVLEQIRAVMAGVEVGDTDLINLYANKGAADPGLIATVLAYAAAEDGYLLPDVWHIVTLDQANGRVGSKFLWLGPGSSEGCLTSGPSAVAVTLVGMSTSSEAPVAFSTRIPESLRKEVRLRALELDLSVQDAAAEALRQWLKETSATS